MALTFDDVFAEQDEFFHNMEREASYYMEQVKDISRGLRPDEIQETIFKLAFTRAYEYVEGIATQVLLSKPREAAIETEEYNYPPYLAQLEDAIRSNIQSGVPLIKITPDENDRSVYVSVDLTPLGGVEIWADAVKKARESLPGNRWADGHMRSEQWKRLIYGTAREGRKVFRKKKNKESGENDYVDITDNWSYRYDEIVRLRLSYLAPTQAPFWYLIEHGNAGNITGAGGTVSFHSEGHSPGWPYPSFGPTRFVQQTESFISELVLEAYWKFKAEADNHIAEMLSDMLKDIQTGAGEIAGRLKRRKTGEYILEDFHNALEDIYARNLENTEKFKRFQINLEEWRADMKKIDDSYVHVVFYSEHHQKVISYSYKKGTRVNLE